jgi:drug/metabolite transporter (DMT)-like permease
MHLKLWAAQTLNYHLKQPLNFNIHLPSTINNTMTPQSAQSSWQLIALTSGTFAALNGVFAKLTTSSTTTTLITSLARTLQLDVSHIHLLEYALRVAIFLATFALSSTMWALYTRALAAAPSAVHANVVNTSANFVVAALVGWAVFGEKLGGMWWVGAACLIAGTVVIGRGRVSDNGKGDGKVEGKRA